MESTITTIWQRILDDPALRDLPYKVETNETGQIILSPHKPRHSHAQTRIADLMRDHATQPGERAVEFAIETPMGIKVPDVVWISEERWEALPDDAEASPFAPEICVEVLSGANTDAEMEEKRRLYFEGGAREVWLCDEEGAMTFYVIGEEKPIAHSLLLPGFPLNINAEAG